MSGPISPPIKFCTFCRSEEIKTTLVSFVIESLDSSIEFQVEKAYTVPDIKLSRRNIDWPNIKKRWTHLEDLELPTTNSSLVEILIGMDVDTAHVQLDSRTPVEENQGPRAVLTPFGWIVTGKVPSSILQGPSPRRSVHFGNAQEVDAALVDAVQQFWSTESFETNTNAKKVISEDDARAIKILESSIVDVGQRYQVGLLLKTPNIQLPNNRPQALKRLFSVEQRLQRNSGHAEKYKKIIDSYLSDGYAKKVPYREINNPVGKVWYLPHHFVVNPNKPDKLRVVFNGSARYKGICLNDVLLRGPILLSNLVGVPLKVSSTTCSYLGRYSQHVPSSKGKPSRPISSSFRMAPTWEPAATHDFPNDSASFRCSLFTYVMFFRSKAYRRNESKHVSRCIR